MGKVYIKKEGKVKGGGTEYAKSVTFTVEL
jgi:hypothetical protein